ncbi:protein-L-isoaspartate O-methyltransferase [Novosphingobium colocasiae]|uniref:protein-L-isoaspartate O-methyltransferase family protein n=1 Tax=Novosphingobium colocasiae TaxID=1256513 RepID=UPI0035B3E2F6
MTLTEDRSTPSATAIPAARRAMIVSQLRTCGVNEQWVLEAMGQVAREDFVPADLKEAAYIDRGIALGDGRWLASPLVCAKVLAEAAPQKSDTALLVGDGAGYLAALLRPFVGSLDSVAPADAANAAGAGTYSLIVIDGAVEELPAALVARLAEGGRVVTGLSLRGVTRLAAGCKASGQVALQPLAELGFAVLPEFAAPKRWSF